MTTTATDLSEYLSKEVIVHYEDGSGTTQEIIGKVDVVHPQAFLVKIRGKGNAQIIDTDKLVDIELAPEKDKKVKVRWLADVTVDDAKAHLADRHGARVKDLNNMTSQGALEWHAGFDHEALDLAHRHGEKPKRGAAAGAAEGEE